MSVDVVHHISRGECDTFILLKYMCKVATHANHHFLYNISEREMTWWNFLHSNKQSHTHMYASLMLIHLQYLSAKLRLFSHGFKIKWFKLPVEDCVLRCSYYCLNIGVHIVTIFSLYNANLCQSGAFVKFIRWFFLVNLY